MAESEPQMVKSTSGRLASDVTFVLHSYLPFVSRWQVAGGTAYCCGFGWQAASALNTNYLHVGRCFDANRLYI
jgi:hypothetical protein